MPGPIPVQVENISFSYNGQPVLNRVNLTVNQGDYLGVVGANGAGKSTLVRVMLGLLRPQTGTVRLFGKKISEFRDWGRIGYLSQKVGAFNRDFPATVEEIVRANPALRRGGKLLSRQEELAAVNEALAAVGLAEKRGVLLGRLSGGQQQRAFLARVLVARPELVFLDEPTTGIDPEAREEFYDLLLDLNRSRNMTVVLVTHDIAAVASRATRIVYMVNGHPHEYRPEDLRRLTGQFLDQCMICNILRRSRAGSQ